MAEKKFIADVNLKGNQIKEVVAEILSQAPSAPTKGRFYFDSTDNKFKYYNGSAWIAGAEYIAKNKAVDQEGIQYGVLDETSGTQFIFRVIKTEDTRIKLAVAEGVISLTLDMKYQSAMPDELTVPTAIGGIAAGVSAADLKTKTVDQVLDDILFPEINPTVQNPTASLAFKSGFSANGVYEIGATAPVDPDNFTKTFNRGTCTAPGQPTKYRAGAEQTGSSFIYVGGSTTNKTLPTKVTLGSMQYNYQAAYAQGDELKTSKGNKATHNSSGQPISQNPLPAGTVNSGAIYIYGTYPYFSNGIQASTTNNELGSLPSSFADKTKFTSLVRIDNNSKIAAKFASEATYSVHAKLYIPSSKKITKVMAMNVTSGKFDVDMTSAWQKTGTENIEVQSEQVSYDVWETQGGFLGGNQYLYTIANV